jgi:transcriptional regulator with XRE-family HTH domain
VSIGEDLAAARRRAGLTLTQVSKRTCIRETLICAIERDDHHACGGDFYARGHIRAIAHAVGADPGPLIAEYDAAHGPPRPVTAADLLGPAKPVRIRERHRLTWGAGLGIVLAAVVGVVAYHVFAASHPAPAVHPAARTGLHRAVLHRGRRAVAATAPAAARPSPAPYAHKVAIHLTAIEDCWVEFTSPAGAYLSQSVVAGGTSKRWVFWYAVNMRLGNPGGIRLTVDGKHPLPPGTVEPVTLRLRLGGKISS